MTTATRSWDSLSSDRQLKIEGLRDDGRPIVLFLWHPSASSATTSNAASVPSSTASTYRPDRERPMRTLAGQRMFVVDSSPPSSATASDRIR